MNPLQALAFEIDRRQGVEWAAHHFATAARRAEHAADPAATADPFEIAFQEGRAWAKQYAAARPEVAA